MGKVLDRSTWPGLNTFEQRKSLPAAWPCHRLTHPNPPNGDMVPTPKCWIRSDCPSLVRSRRKITSHTSSLKQNRKALYQEWGFHELAWGTVRLHPYASCTHSLHSTKKAQSASFNPPTFTSIPRYTYLKSVSVVYIDRGLRFRSMPIDARNPH